MCEYNGSKDKFTYLLISLSLPDQLPYEVATIRFKLLILEGLSVQVHHQFEVCSIVGVP